MQSLETQITDLAQEKDYASRKTIAEQIASYGQEAIAPLIDILRQFATDDDYFAAGSDNHLHVVAEDVLVVIGQSAVPALIPLITSDNWGERHGAIFCLREIGDERAITPLVNALVSDDVNVITEIQEALAVFGEKALAPLREASQSDNPTLREYTDFCLLYQQNPPAN